MTLKDVTKDLANQTLIVTAEFEASIDRVWQLYADPRQLERWWGPPSYPATVLEHDLAPGGLVRYVMTGPDGDTSAGWWRVVSVDPPRALVVEDGFADDSGQPNPDLPTTTMHVALAEHAGITQVVTTSTFASTEAMQQLFEMGMEEGLKQSVGQMDDALAG